MQNRLGAGRRAGSKAREDTGVVVLDREGGDLHLAGDRGDGVKRMDLLLRSQN